MNLWIAILVLNGVTAFIGILVGLLCWKKHSPFPRTEVGYHVGEAMQQEQAWEKGNKYAGKLCLFGGLAFFVLLPLCLFLTGVSKGWLLAAYFMSAVVYILLVVFLPARILKRK